MEMAITMATKMNKNDKKIIKLVTHNGSFHADDVFACAALSLMLEKKKQKFKITRTRDEKIIKAGDYVFDVGGIYDLKKNRFDHHQRGGAGKTKEGVEYASFGLVWKKFGKQLCGGDDIAKVTERRLVQPVDAFDNGFDLVQNKHEISPFFIQHVFMSMRPTWRENVSNDKMFLESVKMAKKVLMREIIQAQDLFAAKNAVLSIYRKTRDKRIIVLDKNYPYEYLLSDFSAPKFVIYKRKSDNLWGAKALRKDPKSFKNKKDFPKSWAGLRDEDLQKVSGVSDAVFCHRGLFLAVAKSKVGALKLAQIALKS